MSTLIKAVQDATGKDLEDIDARVAELESELSAMKIVRRVILAKLGEPDEKGGKTRSEGGGAGDRASRPAPDLTDKRIRVAQSIAKNGPQTLSKLSDATGISKMGVGCLKHVLACDWFHVNADDVASLTTEGTRRARLNGGV